MTMILTPLQEFPLVSPGDDLAGIIVEALTSRGLELQDGDILVLAQKIVSKAEGRQVSLKTVLPSPEAVDLAAKSQKDPRLVEVVVNGDAQLLHVALATRATRSLTGLLYRREQ